MNSLVLKKIELNSVIGNEILHVVITERYNSAPSAGISSILTLDGSFLFRDESLRLDGIYWWWLKSITCVKQRIRLDF